MAPRGLRKALTRVPGLRRLVHAARAVRARAAALRRSVGGDKGRTADTWGRHAAAKAAGAPEAQRYWTSSPQILKEYIFGYFGGIDWYGFIRTRYCDPTREHGLSLCCGDGFTERQLVLWDSIRRCEGIDLSEEAIAVARAQAEAEGLHTMTYRVADIETLTLPPESYDLVVFWQGLHHLRRPERILREVGRALRPEGILLVNDYVGPARFQLPQVQVDLINKWLKQLPPELRREPNGVIRETFTPPTVEQVIAFDASEAVCSDQILPILTRDFPILERIDWGGALLQFLLDGIVQNFSPEDPEHRAWITRLCEADNEVLEKGVLPTSFTFVIAGKPHP